MSERSSSSQSTSHKEMSTSGSANRMQAQSCPVTTSTTSFGLITSDGQFVRFDEASNAKVSQELKTNNKWTKDVNGGKQISAKVRGTMMGDSLQVESVK